MPEPRRGWPPAAPAFTGRITGVARFGLFVKLDETGADGLVPIRSLGEEFFHHDPDSQTLTGEKSRQVLGLGQAVTVKLAEAEPATGGLILELLEVEGQALARRKGTGRAKLRKGKIGSDARRRANRSGKQERAPRCSVPESGGSDRG